MRLETAVYGEVNNGHALRDASGDAEFARSIAGRFDLPSSPPPGVGWSPAISGFPVQGRYVLGRTFLDTQAPRGNMVLAHAMFAPLDAMQCFSAIDRLIGLLAPAVDQVPPVAALVVEDSENPITSEELPGLTALLIDRGRKPVIRLGAEGIETLVSALWQKMWPSMRRGFAFRLSFTPEDLVESPTPALVYTPASLAVRWPSFSILGQTSAAKSRAADLLNGSEDASPVARFAASIGHHNTSLVTFPHLVHADTLITGAGGIEGQAQALRLINFLSPSPTEGVAAKQAIVTALAEAISSADADAIMLLRNLTLDGVNNLGSLWCAVSRWIVQRLLDAAHAKALLPLLIASRDDEQAIPTWRDAVHVGSKELAVAQPRAFAVAVWGWLVESPNILPALLTILPRDRTTEDSLLRSIPSQISFPPKALLAAWRDRGWLELHGATLSLCVDPEEAVIRQLAIDTDPTFVDGLNAALRRAEPTELLAIAARYADDRLDQIAAARLVADRHLGKTLDFSQQATQRLWAVAIRIDPEGWQIPEEPHATRRALLDNVRTGGVVFGPLLRLLSTTPLANLLDFQHRGEIWSRIEGSDDFLTATAKAWLAHAATGVAVPLDAELERATLQLIHLDAALGPDWTSGINVIAALEPLTENRAVRWFNDCVAAGHPVPHSVAERLGHVILARRWTSLLKHVLRNFNRHLELHLTLRICANMLPILTRWSLNISKLSQDEKWDGFVSLATQLYPAGPGDRHLWERAGGRDSDLLTKVSGAEMWHHAMRGVRYGNRPRAMELIVEMQKDYSSNPELQLIARDRDVVGG